MASNTIKRKLKANNLTEAVFMHKAIKYSTSEVSIHLSHNYSSQYTVWHIIIPNYTSNMVGFYSHYEQYIYYLYVENGYLFSVSDSV